MASLDRVPGAADTRSEQCVVTSVVGKRESGAHVLRDPSEETGGFWKDCWWFTVAVTAARGSSSGRGQGGCGACALANLPSSW